MNDATRERDEPEHRPAVRRSYSKPGVIDSAVFETLAASCGKTAAEFACQAAGAVSVS